MINFDYANLKMDVNWLISVYKKLFNKVSIKILWFNM